MSKLTNSSKTELNSICLKPKIPGNIQILNIKPNKTYTINPLNIVAYSSNIDFKIKKTGGITMGTLFSKNLLNMIEVKSKKKGVIFLVSYGNSNENYINKLSYIHLGQLIAYDDGIEIVYIKKLIKPKIEKFLNFHDDPGSKGIPFNYLLYIKGSGKIYYQDVNYFNYIHNQLGVFDKKFIKKPTISQKEKKVSINISKHNQVNYKKRFIITDEDKKKINFKIKPKNVIWIPLLDQYIQYYVLSPGKLNDILFRAVIIESIDKNQYISFSSNNTSKTIVRPGEMSAYMDVLYKVKIQYNPFINKFDNKINNVVFDDTGNYIVVFLADKKNDVPYDTYLYKLKYIGVKKLKTLYNQVITEILEIEELEKKPKNINFSNINKSLLKKITNYRN